MAKKYIGQHKASSFDESYKGSGKLIKEALKKYGLKNFKTILIEICESVEDLNEKEIFYIKLNGAVNNVQYYNLAKGGLGHSCSP